MTRCECGHSEDGHGPSGRCTARRCGCTSFRVARINATESAYEPRMISNREVRWIPRGWQHPKDENGRFLPLLPYGRGEEAAAEMPAASGEDPEIAAYETTTEGTPISPAYPNTPEGRLAMANWCAEHAFTWGDHRADAETWAVLLFGEPWATIGLDGSVQAS